MSESRPVGSPEAGPAPTLPQVAEGDDRSPRPGLLARGLTRSGAFDRPNVWIVFLVATIGTVFFVGMEHAVGFYAMVGREVAWTSPAVLGQALIYTAALMAILGTHEFGHWIMARREGVRTSPPVFIPMPLGIGTFGAVIAMQELPPTRASLIRIGAAGPLAGGVVALAVMAVAIQTCPTIPTPGLDPATDGGMSIELGSSIGTILMESIFAITVPEGRTPLATPLFFAAWTGFLLTSINLIPVGQLDGGHVLYGLIGERANRWARWLAIGVMCLSFWGIGSGLSLTYLVWGLLLLAFVAWHPPVPRPEPALPWDARWWALACLLLFALTFMPLPMRMVW